MKTAKAEELDKMFDNGEDMSEYMDLEHITSVNPQPKQISISLPQWLVNSLDNEAHRRGVARKAIINTALVEWVDELNQTQAV